MARSLKLGRAKEHFATLNADLGRYIFDPQTCRVAPSPSEDRKKHTFTATLNEDPPAEWGLLIGDTLHNLRCALDHMVWKLADPAQRGNHTMFPVFTSRDEFFETDKKGKPTWRSGLRKLSGVADEPFAIIEAAQPYNPGDRGSAFQVLNDLENVDKHRTMHTAAAFARIRSMNVPNLGPGEHAEVEAWVGPLSPVGEETEIVRVSLPSAEAAVDMQIDFAFEMLFKDTGVVDGATVDRTLSTLIAEVEGIAADLDPHLP